MARGAFGVACGFAHPREAERVEDVCIGELRVVVVYRMRRRAEHGALWDEHAVIEDDVLQRDPYQGRCTTTQSAQPGLMAMGRER